MIILALAATAVTARTDPIRFFTGATEGRGRLKVALHHARSVRVEGHGRLEPDGTLILDQTVTQEGKVTTQRRWRLRQDAPGHYAGTLTDAVGPVSAEERGGRFRIAYRAKGGVRIEQWITVATNGRSAQNRLVARKLGVAVAHLDEAIRKTD